MDLDIIDPRLAFYGFEEFYNNRFIIKDIFEEKDIKEQCIYKWYLYSRPFISENFKNYMWDFLQNDMSNLDFMLACLKNKR